jgi:DNA-binding cell septation regulator SpoVG
MAASYQLLERSETISPQYASEVSFWETCFREKTTMKAPQISVEIRQSAKVGATKAYADVRLDFPDGEIRLIGFGIVKQPGKSPWVGFPESRGQTQYFKVVEAKGRIRESIIKAILTAYSDSKADS